MLTDLKPEKTLELLLATTLQCGHSCIVPEMIELKGFFNFHSVLVAPEITWLVQTKITYVSTRNISGSITPTHTHTHTHSHAHTLTHTNMKESHLTTTIL